jgi:SAM-dependent methyltransferase
MNEQDYFKYLKGRSALAGIYRKLVLYPALSKEFHGKVLDVGCGIGDFLAFRENTVGIDINPYNIEFCKNRHLEAYAIENGKFPFPDKTFDGLILDNVLEHLEDPAPTLTEIQRVLKPKGVFIVGVPGKKGYSMDSDHKRFYQEPDLQLLLSNYKLKPYKYIYGPAFIKSDWLSRRLSQYCIFGVFRNVD